MDMQDKWWKVWLINIALADVAAAHAEQQVPGPSNPSKEETTHMADVLTKMGKTLDKVKLALNQHLSRTLFIKSTDLFYSSIIWNENLTAATLDKVDESDYPALLIPSIQTIEAFRQHQDWFNYEEYQQQDYKKACQELKIINPKTLKITNI